MIFDMIIVGFLQIVEEIVNLLPTIPASGLWTGTEIIDFTDLLFTNLGLLGMVVNLGLLTSILTTMLLCMTIKFGYSLIMWVFHKIPFVGVK